jgi:hypothetical protein
MKKAASFLVSNVIAAATYSIAAGNVSDLPYEQLSRLITITQFLADLCLTEIEDRGKLTWAPGADGQMVPIVPYDSDVAVETLLNRPLPDSVMKL